MIETERLILRRWRAADRAPYAAMMADPEVGYWLGATLSEAEALAQINRFESEFDPTGKGFWAIERKADGAFLGAAALVTVIEAMPPAPATEIGWRLARAAWGCGYATEAARALLAHGFEKLGLTEIIAFTAETNLRSQAVMGRLGMARDAARDFDHPAIAADHPLRRHVVYVARAPIPA